MENNDKFDDIRDRFPRLEKKQRQLFNIPQERELTWIIDLGIYGARFFEWIIQSPCNHVITWEKDFKSGESKQSDGHAISAEEDAGCQRSASWCATLSDNWPMTGSGTQHSAGGLVLNGDFVSLQHPKDARSNMVAKPTSRHKRKRVATIVAAACAVACMGGCALYMSIRQEPEPPVPPPRESQPSSTTWAVEPNKVVAWCADSWGCRPHADEQLPAPRMKRVLDDVLKTMPTAADQAVVDAWVIFASSWGGR